MVCIGGASLRDKKNFKWTRHDIAYQYKLENPNWTWDKCWIKSDLIYKELKRLNKQMWDNNKRFFDNNIQFSALEDRDDEFGKQFYDWASN